MKWSDFNNTDPVKLLQNYKEKLASTTSISKHLMKQLAFDKYKELSILTDTDLRWITLID